MTSNRVDSYRDLIAWQKAVVLARSVYQLTDTWPVREQFGLIAQIRRCAVSVPSNIAEGAGRSGEREFRHGLSLAHGSLCELETQLIIAMELGFGDHGSAQQVFDQALEVGRIIRGLTQKLDRSIPRPPANPSP